MDDSDQGSRPPSIDALARALADRHPGGLPHPLLVDVARDVAAEIRDGTLSPDDEAVGDRADVLVRAAGLRLLQPVVNATGVLLHTNLGRAPVAHHLEPTYTNLEFDLASGERGSRSERTAALVARACDAPAALVVNNGAAAVMLVLAALARGRGVAVSRGELVEIGGGFRVPEVMEQSGARLVEIGTTNRTRRSDVIRAVEENDLGVILKVHQSNFRIVGFTESLEVADLVGHGVPVVADLGSGLLDTACPWLPDGPPAWLSGEPGVRQALEAGADLVTFSGDKLLGGPQAGIIVGEAGLVSRCARHPLARSLRPGALVLSALQETALAYLRRDGLSIPFWQMATEPVDALRTRARALGAGAPLELESLAGGGTLPGRAIPSAGVAVPGDHRRALLDVQPPVAARVEDGRTLLDLRTVHPVQDDHVRHSLLGLP